MLMNCVLHCTATNSTNFVTKLIKQICIFTTLLTVGGDRFTPTVEPLRSWGPILECLLIGNPPPGVPPGEEAQEGAIRILGVISVLSDSLRFGKALTTRRKLLSGEDGEPPNHQPPSMPPKNKFKE